MKTIVGDTPSAELLKDQDLSFTNSLRLSDPNFTKPGGVDLLLGQDVLVHILSNGLVKSGDGKLLQNSSFNFAAFTKDLKMWGFKLKINCYLNNV